MKGKAARAVAKKGKNESVTVQSQSSSIVHMQNKLMEVASPSSSKPEDDDEFELEEEQLAEDQSQTIDSEASIPMAHREYEKILRQLEAECRTHIKCE